MMFLGDTVRFFVMGGKSKKKVWNKRKISDGSPAYCDPTKSLGGLQLVVAAMRHGMQGPGRPISATTVATAREDRLVQLLSVAYWYWIACRHIRSNIC